MRITYAPQHHKKRILAESPPPELTMVFAYFSAFALWARFFGSAKYISICLMIGWILTPNNTASAWSKSRRNMQGDYEAIQKARFEKERPVIDGFLSWLEQQKPTRGSTYCQLSKNFKAELDDFLDNGLANPDDGRYRISCARFLLCLQNKGLQSISQRAKQGKCSQGFALALNKTLFLPPKSKGEIA